MEVGERIVGAQVVTIGRGGAVRDLPSADVDPDDVASLPVRTERWGDTTIEGVLAHSQARSLVVLHEGRLAYEWYGDGGDPDRRNRCYSVTKSFTGTLASTAMHEGLIDRTDTVGDLLHELAAIGFGDYMLALGLELPDAVVPGDAPRTIRDLLAAVRPGRGPHGEVFMYATPCTDVLGWLLEQARGMAYPDLLAEAIWSRIGAEHDARLSLDPAGTPTLGAGLAVTTRDLARFGLALGEITPVDVLDDIRDGGDREVFQRGGQYDYLSGYSYHDQWWLPGGPSRPLSAWGIHGQVLWVDPDAGVVVATHCGGPDPSDQRRDVEQDAMCRALTVAAAHWPTS